MEYDKYDGKLLALLLLEVLLEAWTRSMEVGRKREIIKEIQIGLQNTAERREVRKGMSESSCTRVKQRRKRKVII